MFLATLIRTIRRPFCRCTKALLTIDLTVVRDAPPDPWRTEICEGPGANARPQENQPDSTEHERCILEGSTAINVTMD